MILRKLSSSQLWPKIPTAALVLSAFLIGILWGKSIQKIPPPEQAIETRQNNSSYRFTNPLLECDLAGETLSTGLIPFKNVVEGVVYTKIAQGDISNAAVYFRDLNNGPWFGVNEQMQFLPASLLKVPVMMAYFKDAEQNPDILKKKLKLQSKFPSPGGVAVQIIRPSHEIEVSKEYTVEELVEAAIKYSDNQAVSLLYDDINKTMLQDVYSQLNMRVIYKDLDVNNAVLNGPGGTLSVKTYASFFRILFNASYLTRSYSEKALQLLSQAEFHDGLVAGVPHELKVAHKFGESGYDSEEKQLHDCGIIYYPQHPYLLCVMTKGKNFPKLAPTIKDISATVFNEVNLQFKRF